jgi:D-alanyl-D-alanine carboxypeptidase
VLIGVELHEPSWPQTYAQMTAMLDDGFAGIPYQFSSTPPLAAPLPPPPTAWVAEIGLYPTRAIARSHALTAAHLRGEGVPRITRVSVHGKILWRAQLAGLTRRSCAGLGSACHAAPLV